MNSGWRVRGGRSLGGEPFLLFGILNVTPDSFYDGGRYLGVEAALEQARRLGASGAQVVDVGGVSTRPGGEEAGEREEARRLAPVLKQLCAMRGPDSRRMLVSVDTFRAGVAAQALEAGAAIINDVSACRRDPGLLDVLVQYQPGYVLMYADMARGELHGRLLHADVVEACLAFFETMLGRLVGAGVDEERIMVDPGIGFGKTLEDNLALLGGLGRLQRLGRPVLLGVSNKSVFGSLLGRGEGERRDATVAATVLGYQRGAWAHRVHEAGAARDALRVAAAIGKYAS